MEYSEVTITIPDEHTLGDVVSRLGAAQALSRTVPIEWLVDDAFRVTLMVDGKLLEVEAVAVIGDGTLLEHISPDPHDADERVCTFFVVRHVASGIPDRGEWVASTRILTGDGSLKTHHMAGRMAANFIFS